MVILNVFVCCMGVDLVIVCFVGCLDLIDCLFCMDVFVGFVVGLVLVMW